jgi:hypothetical protein
MNKFTDLTNKEFIKTFTGIPAVPESSSRSHERSHEKHRRFKRSPTTLKVPATFKIGNVDLRTAKIPVLVHELQFVKSNSSF